MRDLTLQFNGMRERTGVISRQFWGFDRNDRNEFRIDIFTTGVSPPGDKP